MSPHFGVIFEPFLTPFLGGSKKGQKWPKNAKNHVFQPKMPFFGKMPHFSHPDFWHFCISASPPAQNFGGGTPKIPPKKGFFDPFLGVFFRQKRRGRGYPQKNDHFGVIFAPFLGSQNPKMGSKMKNPKNRSFLTPKFIKKRGGGNG